MTDLETSVSCWYLSGPFEPQAAVQEKQEALVNPLERGDRERPGTATTGYLQYLSLGLQFALSVALCTYGGYWIDTKLESIPWGTLIGAAFGFASGIVWLNRAVFPKKPGKPESPES